MLAHGGLGNRVQKTVSSVVTDHLLDIQPGLTKVLRESDGTNTTHYIHSPRGVHAQYDGSSWDYYVQDGLGSIRNDGISYDPYGNPTGTIPANFGFTGEQTDGNGQVYLRARYYNPDKGVFTALDPWEGVDNRPMSLNEYSWVEGRVINWRDPYGLGCFDLISNNSGEDCPASGGSSNSTTVIRVGGGNTANTPGGTTAPPGQSLANTEIVWRNTNLDSSYVPGNSGGLGSYAGGFNYYTGVNIPLNYGFYTPSYYGSSYVGFLPFADSYSAYDAFQICLALNNGVCGLNAMVTLGLVSPTVEPQPDTSPATSPVPSNTSEDQVSEDTNQHTVAILGPGSNYQEIRNIMAHHRAFFRNARCFAFEEMTSALWILRDENLDCEIVQGFDTVPSDLSPISVDAVYSIRSNETLIGPSPQTGQISTFAQQYLKVGGMIYSVMSINENYQWLHEQLDRFISNLEPNNLRSDDQIVSGDNNAGWDGNGIELPHDQFAQSAYSDHYMEVFGRR